MSSLGCRRCVSSPTFWLAAVGLVAASLGVGWSIWEGRPQRVFQLGLEALDRGDTEAVVRAAARLQRFPDFEPHSELLLGAINASTLDDPAAAFRQLRAAEQKESLRARALMYQAELLYRLSRFRDSADAARRALDIDPGLIMARRWLASACYDLGDTGEAVAQLKILGDAAPDGRAHRLLGLIYKDQEQFADAASAYRESLRRDPNPADESAVRYELALTLVKAHDYAGAQKALRDVDDSADVLNLRAECADAQGESEKSLELVQKALQHDSEHKEARLLLGKLHLSAGRVPQAIETLERLVKAHPEWSTAHHLLSQAWTRQGDKLKAAAELEKMKAAQKIETEFFEGHSQAARDPENVQIRFRIGQLAEQLRRPELAGVWYRAALALDANHTGAKEALEKLNAK